MMAPTLVTIGITCFNAEGTIRRAIHSAINQDWPDCEVVVVDDASTDQSVAAVMREIEGEPTARLVRHTENKGPAAARNTVLDQALGSFVAFIDDDDEALSGRISAQVSALQQFEKETGADLIACYASGRRLYDNGYSLELPAIGSRGSVAPSGHGVADYLLFGHRRSDWFYGGGTPACSVLARRTTFARVGGFDEAFARVKDADFAIRLALIGGHFIGTSEVQFIRHATSAPDKSHEKNLQAELHLAEKHKNYLSSIGRYHYASHWPKLRYWHFKHNYWRFFWEFLGLLVRYPVAAPRHLLSTGPSRLLHERRMGEP